MRILHLSKDDIGGGAGKAAYRLHQGLRLIGEDSWMLVSNKQSDDDHVIEIPKGLGYVLNKIGGRLEDLLAKWFLDEGIHWDISIIPAPVVKLIRQINPDVINLHWINRGVISVGQIARLKIPVFWTFHDMWAATSGYHYYGDLLKADLAPADGRFEENASGKPLAKTLLSHKISAWRGSSMQIVCPSRWLQRVALESTAFAGRKVHHVPYGLDLDVYKPVDQKALRKELGLPLEKKLILFGAASSSADLRKGSDLLLKALGLAIGSNRFSKEDVALVVFGEQQKLEDFGDVDVFSLGYLKGDVAVARAYSAVDCFVAPSREDNLPNTVLESLASGIPVIAFRIGGMPDMITHKQTGFLVEPFEIDGLMDAILWVIGLSWEDRERLTRQCRKKALDDFPLRKQAEQYKNLYLSMTSSNKNIPSSF